MIELITAIGNTYINKKIKNIKNYNVVFRDIQYKEGILETLKSNKDIKILLVSIDILEEIDFIEKIQEKHKDLEIIVFINKKKESEITYFNSKGIYKIYLNNENGYEECLKKLTYMKNNIEEIRNEMKELKNQILEKQKKKVKNEKDILIPRIILFSGARGVRKECYFNNIFKIYRKTK